MARTERLLDWSVASLLSCPGKQRPNDIVLLDDLVLAQSIDPKTPTLLLLSVPPTTTTLADLHTHLPPTSPQYTFFSFTPPKASATPIVIFVYTCPSKSPIRMRMVYSSSVASLIRAVGEKAGVQVAKKVSTYSWLRSECHHLELTPILSLLPPPDRVLRAPHAHLVRDPL